MHDIIKVQKGEHMNEKQLLQFGIETLQKANIEESSLKARLLLEHILKQTRNQYLANELQEVLKKQEEEYCKKLTEIMEGKPIQYITHEQYFMGLCFYVDENVLIPQPDTEILVEKAIEIAKNRNKNIKILDIGTGSGAIAISLAKYLESAKVTAIDISKEALQVAKRNAKEQEVEIDFIQSDLFENLKDEQFDMIVSNPPYIETNVIPTLEKEVQNEPILALDGGIDGLKFYREILRKAHLYLKEERISYFRNGI